ncbi:MAG: HRDC domain-containing protein [Actinomycetes bacterium]
MDEVATRLGPPASATEALALTEPCDGVPEVVADPAALGEAARRLAAGSGPVAVDAERASGHRYGQRAYLVQLRRAGAGTVLVDPVALPDLTALRDALRGITWVVHAANQDLACLAEVGLVPDRLFDTELAGRLLGLPRVGLATMVGTLLGRSLAKEHSAVDWSVRPLPEPWLRYAALDVELLVELRDVVDLALARTGKQVWAQEEFAWVRATTPGMPGVPRTLRPDPWRRTGGLHRVRDRRGLAVVRELWTTRDRTAAALDVAPGRLLPDAAIVEAALARPSSVAELGLLAKFRGPGQRRRGATWFAAIERATALDPADLPGLSLPLSGPPPVRSWPERDPVAAARLAAIRAAVRVLGVQVGVPAENVLAPELLRRLAWEPPTDTSERTVAAALRALGARPWQVGLTAARLAEQLTATAADAPAATNVSQP